MKYIKNRENVGKDFDIPQDVMDLNKIFNEYG